MMNGLPAEHAASNTRAPSREIERIMGSPGPRELDERPAGCHARDPSGIPHPPSGSPLIAPAAEERLESVLPTLNLERVQHLPGGRLFGCQRCNGGDGRLGL